MAMGLSQPSPASPGSPAQPSSVVIALMSTRHRLCQGAAVSGVYTALADTLLHYLQGFFVLISFESLLAHLPDYGLCLLEFHLLVKV